MRNRDQTGENAFGRADSGLTQSRWHMTNSFLAARTAYCRQVRAARGTRLRLDDYQSAVKGAAGCAAAALLS